MGLGQTALGRVRGPDREPASQEAPRQPQRAKPGDDPRDRDGDALSDNSSVELLRGYAPSCTLSSRRPFPYSRRDHGGCDAVSLSLSKFAAALSVSAIVGSTAAWAACPGAFSTASCDGSLGTDICESDGAGGIICDLGANGTPTEGGEGWFLSDGVDSFRAYGSAGQGEAFCCEFAIDSGVCVGTFQGTNYPDQMQFYDSLSALSLICIDAVVTAGGGNDWITGSDYTVGGYGDEIYGEGESDTINLKGGNDYAYGGNDNDQITGGEGLDNIFGDDGQDKIKGGNGNDYVDGGPGNGDQVCGESGEDWVYGGNGDNDIAFGGADDDVINSGDLSADGTGDNCENDSPDATYCEFTTQTTCPW
jgi:hypothetical protein